MVLVCLYQGVQAGVVNYSYGVIVVPISEEFETTRFMLMMGVSAATLVVFDCGHYAASGTTID